MMENTRSILEDRPNGYTIEVIEVLDGTPARIRNIRKYSRLLAFLVDSVM